MPNLVRPSTYRLIALAAVLTTSSAFAEVHTAGVPSLNSRSGAAFTVYLDVNGFTYDGLWSASKAAPGYTPSVGDVAANGTFNTAQVGEIKNIWSRMAQSYIGLNVNVTTVDPAVAALGANATDAQRQAFYDATPNLMHTVIGSQVRVAGSETGLTANNKWYSDAADGVSGLGVISGTSNATGAGGHTNWMFTEDQQSAGVINGDYIGAISAHENGHAFGLSHQGDWTGNTLVNEYTNGDAAGDKTTPGTYVATIGNASDRQRVAWRVGNAHDQNDPITGAPVAHIVNDLQAMLTTDTVAASTAAGRTGGADLHFIEDGKGHTLGSATQLALVGDTVDYNLAKGVIVPKSETAPAALGASNYTQDVYSFLSLGTVISLTAHDSTDFLTPGVADGVGTLRSTLSILDSVGNVVGTGIEDASTLFETFTGSLPAGAYYAVINSFGGHEQISPTFNAAQYFDTGAYFLTGSGFVVPEPTSLMFLAIAAYGMTSRRRSQIA